MAAQQVKIPKDSEGYHKSFVVTDEEQLKEAVAFFKEFGFVVFRDIVPPEVVEGVADHLWTYLPNNLVRNDPTTWPEALRLAQNNWNRVAGSGYNSTKGFLGSNIMIDNQAPWNVRQHPNVYKAFSAILDDDQLFVEMDRYGVMRPTKLMVTNEDGTTTVEEHPEWKTEERWIHWDQNPWTEPGFCKVQGLLAVSEHNETSGGFHCIPGFTGEFIEWGQRNMELKSTRALVDMPKADPAMDRIVRICMRKGSILIWDSRTPHGNYPNEGFGWRMVMYVTMAKKSELPSTEVERFKHHYTRFFEQHPNIHITPLGEQLLCMK